MKTSKHKLAPGRLLALAVLMATSAMTLVAADNQLVLSEPATSRFYIYNGSEGPMWMGCDLIPTERVNPGSWKDINCPAGQKSDPARIYVGIAQGEGAKLSVAFSCSNPRERQLFRTTAPHDSRPDKLELDNYHCSP